jgi:hypothetical protein
MLTTFRTKTQLWVVWAAGLISRGPPVGADLGDGFGPILLGVILGAFCGLIVGMITTHLVRFIAYMTGRYLAGHTITLVCVILGAILFGWLTAQGDEN